MDKPNHTPTNTNKALQDSSSPLQGVNQEEVQILNNLLGSDVIVTPTAMTNALAWLLSQMRTMQSNQQAKANDEATAPQDGIYATTQQLAKRYSSSSVTVWRWLRPLVENGKVRVFRTPTNTRQGSFPRYNIADIEAAYVTQG